MFVQPTTHVFHPPADIGPRMRDALQAMREGRPVILMDDADRENEADLIVAAERLTVPTIALLIRECSGIVCLCLTKDAVRRLELPPMVSRDESRFSTAFTVSIEARHGVTTGVSALDRVTTIRAAVAEDAKSDDLVRPGHVFPLCAHDEGVLGRRGHTEGDGARAGNARAAVYAVATPPGGLKSQ